MVPESIGFAVKTNGMVPTLMKLNSQQGGGSFENIDVKALSF